MPFSNDKYEDAAKLYSSQNIRLADLCRQLGINPRPFRYYLSKNHPYLLGKRYASNINDLNKQKRRIAQRKYSKAIELFTESDLSLKDIAVKTNVSYAGLLTHIQKYHRDLLMARYDLILPKKIADKTKLLHKNGQTLTAHKKYRDAIAACDSEDYIGMSIKAIAKEFKVPVSGLGKQLKYHFPEILERRDIARKLSGERN